MYLRSRKDNGFLAELSSVPAFAVCLMIIIISAWHALDFQVVVTIIALNQSHLGCQCILHDDFFLEYYGTQPNAGTIVVPDLLFLMVLKKVAYELHNTQLMKFLSTTTI